MTPRAVLQINSILKLIPRIIAGDWFVMHMARGALATTIIVLATVLAGSLSHGDVRSLSAGGEQIEIAGVHYDMLKAGTLTRRDSCVSLGLVADTRPPYANREMCSCTDGRGFGEQASLRLIVFIGKQQWCPGRPGDVTGMWRLVCCSAKYTMDVDFTQTGTAITGSFADGSTVMGTRAGNTVTFTRDIPGYGMQQYRLTLSLDSNTLTGDFSGRRDTSVGVETVMTRW
jgi:hypothetical protein